MALPTSPLSPTVRLPPVEDQRETAPLDPATFTLPDAVSALDHRSRRRALPRAQAMPGHYLGLEDGKGRVLVIPIDDKITHIGRAGTSDLRFEDPRVSRRHAILVRYGSHVRVLDDRSSEGTFVNGMRIVATDLLDGDVVRLGPVAFTYTIVR